MTLASIKDGGRWRVWDRSRTGHRRAYKGADRGAGLSACCQSDLSLTVPPDQAVSRDGDGPPRPLGSGPDGPLAADAT